MGGTSCRWRPIDDTRQLLAICEAERIGLLVPTIDDELVSVAEAVAKFKDIGTRVAVSDSRRIWSARTSTRLCLPARQRYCRGQTFLPDRCRPRRHSRCSSSLVSAAAASERFRCATNRSSILSGLHERTGRSGVSGRSGVHDRHAVRFPGRPLSIVPRERIVIRAGVIDRDAPSATIADRSGVVDRARPASCRTGQRAVPDGRGVADCVRDQPRFSGGIPLTIAAGADFPRYLLQLAAGQEVAPSIGEFRDNLWMTSHETSTFVRPEDIEGRRLRLPARGRGGRVMVEGRHRASGANGLERLPGKAGRPNRRTFGPRALPLPAPRERRRAGGACHDDECGGRQPGREAHTLGVRDDSRSGPDVLGRFVLASSFTGARYVVRATADNPAVDIDAAAGYFVPSRSAARTTSSSRVASSARPSRP